MTHSDPVDDPTAEHIIQTYSGIYYDYLDPTADMIRLGDIAHHLAGTTRFSAACDPYVSVAEHSVLVCRLVPPELKIAALFHDAAEAYLWDIPKPAKVLYGDIYADLTAKCDKVIAEYLSIDPSSFNEPGIKKADNIMLNFEGNEILPHWSADKPVLPVGVLEWPLGLEPRQAKQLFLNEAAKLGYTAKVDYAPPLPAA